MLNHVTKPVKPRSRQPRSRRLCPFFLDWFTGVVKLTSNSGRKRDFVAPVMRLLPVITMAGITRQARAASASLVAALSLLICPGGAHAESDTPNAPASAEQRAPTAAKALEETLYGLRDLADQRRAEATKALALRIRALPVSAERTKLSVALAWICTEGDPGPETIQHVATTLEQALCLDELLCEDLPVGSTDAVSSATTALARLVHYEGAKTFLNTLRYQAELSRLLRADAQLANADFELKDLDGHVWSLKALRGKVVLVNFWATWCPPCCQELPDLEALYEAFKGDLVVLGLSHEKPEVLRPFAARHAIKYPILPDPDSEVSKRFGVEGIPRTLVYDRNGKLVAQAVDMRTRRQLEALLARAGLSSPTKR